MAASILGVVLDSSILIEAERQRLDAKSFLRYLSETIGEQDVGISSISVAELAHGIHRASTEERRNRRRLFLDDLKAALPIYPVTGETAELVGQLSAEANQRGVVIPFDDLLIAAGAIERGHTVATRNVRHFELIPGLPLIRI
jgi:predicted nucleic acid-binding protein